MYIRRISMATLWKCNSQSHMHVVKCNRLIDKILQIRPKLSEAFPWEL